MFVHRSDTAQQSQLLEKNLLRGGGLGQQLLLIVVAAAD
jgi:hypothetical protein